MNLFTGSLVTSAALALLAGCGGSGDDAATPADAPSAAATTAAGGDCADAQPEIQASLTGMGSITSVEVPSCDRAVVKTSLAVADAQIAAGICQNAANEASGHGVAAVSVVAADGTELAAGTTPADCKAVS
jgi:hypothetical protein